MIPLIPKFMALLVTLLAANWLFLKIFIFNYNRLPNFLITCWLGL